MNIAIVTSIAAITVCSCNQRQQEARTSKEVPDSPAQTIEEIHGSNETVRKIEGWDIGIVGSGPDKRYVELPSMKPITEKQTGDEFVSNDWGFVVQNAQEGLGIFEWPSMKPIDERISPEDQINQDDMPPIPDSRWSR